MSVSPRDPNAEIFLANSQGWKEEAEAVIKDVKDQVKDIFIAEKLESTDCQIYLNVTTVEEQKMTIELSGQGFCVVCANNHDTIEATDVTGTVDTSANYYETPYSLLDHVSPGYRKAFGDNLAKKLRKFSQDQERLEQQLQTK